MRTPPRELEWREEPSDPHPYIQELDRQRRAHKAYKEQRERDRAEFRRKRAEARARGEKDLYAWDGLREIGRGLAWVAFFTAALFVFGVLIQACT